jgi:hypothetical protein
MAAFGSALFRTHIGSNTNPINSCTTTTTRRGIFGDFVRIFRAAG